jgi:putative spermidine/putrescine transport system ATP-binding protein
MAFLELSGIQKRFGAGATAAVENFDLAVDKGEFVSFLGPSGCGKTTTLRMIAGFEKPTAGSIKIDGKEVTNQPSNQRNIGMVFQSYALFPNMTVIQNIGFGLKIRKQKPDIIARRVDELLELINLGGRGNKYPYELSGGMQQRVALARALAIEPQLLLLDEPLSALDAKIRISLRNEIRSIQRQLGITTVYVTHDQEEALSLSDRVVVMSEGRIEQVGSPFEIYNFPKTSFVAKFVGTLNVLAAKVVEPATGRLLLGGQEIRTAKPLSGTAAGDAVSVAIRPESVSIAEGPDGADGANRLSGPVHDITFLGSIVRVRMSLPGDEGTVMFDTFNNPRLRLPQHGDPVTISFAPEASLVLDQPVNTVEPDPVEAEA